MTVQYVIRPLGQWLGPVTPAHARRDGRRFTAPWQNTLDLLTREAELLGGRVVVLQVDVTDGDLRRDGMLRANAKVAFPGVRVSFDSRHGPLTYATDQYDGWRANTRAIALSLEALRAVDRYGVSKRGEQYRGWTAIESGPGLAMTADAAARFIAEHAGRVVDGPPPDPDLILRNREARARAFKAAARRLHPDAGGDPEQFRQLVEARDLIEGRAS
ncbi:hypothetical protein [Micromonospora globbae]|uniref:hypothetical protein n=1 Tax=Micromonospora globbae TaxID=1894969 RepID=UPI00342D8FA9